MRSTVRAGMVATFLIAVLALSRCGGKSPQAPTLPPAITPSSLPNGTLATPYNEELQASGGVGPFTWTVNAGALPHNLQLLPTTSNKAMISGTPDTAAQAVAFTIQATDSTNHSAAQSYTVSILAEPDTLSFTPSGLSFNAQLVGNTSATQAATLTNTGSSPVGITSIAATGTNGTNNSDFGQQNTCGTSVAPAANCTISVTFTPSQFGPRTGVLTVNDSTVGSPHSLSLSGIGLTSGTNATWSAPSIYFGSQSVGTTGSPWLITLSDFGTTTLNIGNISSTANFSDTNTCSVNLVSGASCQIDVTFTPGTTGALTGTLSVTDNAPGSPQTVSLSGTGALGHGSGYCAVNLGDNTLTGYCFHGAPPPTFCALTSEDTSCAVGSQAISPSGVGCGPRGAPQRVDLGRLCP